jgi:hypothetical protein
MRTFLVILILLVFPVLMFGQEKKLSRKEKKELKEKISEANLEGFYNLIESKKFIIEIEQVVSNVGDTYNVEKTTNFCAFDSLNSSIQLSFKRNGGASLQEAKRNDNLGSINYGDKEGINITGKIDRFELSPRKAGKPVRLTGSINNRNGGNSQFSLSVSSSGKTNVTITDKKGVRTTFLGELKSLEVTSVFWRRLTN